MKDLKIICDIDGIVADFMGHYKKWFNVDTYPSRLQEYAILKNVYNLRNNKQFWTTVPKLRDINFPIVAYCTKRINSKSYTKEWIIKNNLPDKPIYQMVCYSGNKSRLIKGKCDVFIEDSITNFIECNKSGVFTLLLTTPENKYYNTPFRIDSLNYGDIYNKYEEYNKY